MTTKWLRISLISLFVFVVSLAFYGLIAVDMLVNDRAVQEETRVIERQIREQEVARLRLTVAAVRDDIASNRKEFIAAKKKIAVLEAKIEEGSETVAASKTMLAQGIDAKFASLSSAVRDVRQRLRIIPRQKRYDILEENLLRPTVQVRWGNEVGSGTVICSRDDETFVLTALHIVGSEGKDDARISVQFFGMHDTISIPADIFASEEKIDVAILKLVTPWKKQHIARLASRERLADTCVFSPVYAIGCPLGYSPMPTKGQISSKTKQLKGQNYWMINAPTIFGNSGGGIYLEETGELIGCLSRVSAYNNFINIAVPHMGIFVPLSEVYDWMDRDGLTFLYDPKYPRELFESRGAAKEDAAKK